MSICFILPQSIQSPLEIFIRRPKVDKIGNRSVHANIYSFVHSDIVLSSNHEPSLRITVDKVKV